MTQDDLLTTKLAEIIDLRLVDQCKDEVEWIREATAVLCDDEELQISPDDDTIEDRVTEIIGAKKNDGEMVFLDRIGSMAII